LRIGVAKHDNVFRIKGDHEVFAITPQRDQSPWPIKSKGQLTLGLRNVGGLAWLSAVQW
jgi:hypothetical protein